MTAIVNRLFVKGEPLRWHLAYLAGLLTAGAVARSVLPSGFGSQLSIKSTPHPAMVVAAGVLVGYGSRLGGGCTSGHGVCGMPRGSTRSFVAVPTFMATGWLSAYTARTLGWRAVTSSKAAALPGFMRPDATWTTYLTPLLTVMMASFLLLRLGGVVSSRKGAGGGG